MSEAGKRLIESAQQALDFARGVANTEDYRIHLPAEIDGNKICEAQPPSPKQQKTRVRVHSHTGFELAT